MSAELNLEVVDGDRTLCSRVDENDLTVWNWAIFEAAGWVPGEVGEVLLDTQGPHEGPGGVWCPVQGSGIASVMSFQRSFPGQASGPVSEVGRSFI